MFARNVKKRFLNTITNGLRMEHDTHKCGRIYPNKRTTFVGKFANKSLGREHKAIGIHQFILLNI